MHKTEFYPTIERHQMEVKLRRLLKEKTYVFGGFISDGAPVVTESGCDFHRNGGQNANMLHFVPYK